MCCVFQNRTGKERLGRCDREQGLMQPRELDSTERVRGFAVLVITAIDKSARRARGARNQNMQSWKHRGQKGARVRAT